MSPETELLFEKTTDRYKNILNRFKPCKPCTPGKNDGREFLEQNLITLLSHEFLSANPDGIVCSEIPVLNDKGHWSGRIDGYLANDDVGLLVEAKGSMDKNPEGGIFKAIEDDILRLLSPKVEKAFKSMSSTGDRSYDLPPTIKILIIAETYFEDEAYQWNNNHQLTDRFSNIGRLSTKVYPIIIHDNRPYSVLVGELEQQLSW
jgi:hypothetical protein